MEPWVANGRRQTWSASAAGREQGDKAQESSKVASKGVSKVTNTTTAHLVGDE